MTVAQDDTDIRAESFGLAIKNLSRVGVALLAINATVILVTKNEIAGQYLFSSPSDISIFGILVPSADFGWASLLFIIALLTQVIKILYWSARFVTSNPYERESVLLVLDRPYLLNPLQISNRGDPPIFEIIGSCSFFISAFAGLAFCLAFVPEVFAGSVGPLALAISVLCFSMVFALALYYMYSFHKILGYAILGRLKVVSACGAIAVLAAAIWAWAN